MKANITVDGLIAAITFSTRGWEVLEGFAVNFGQPSNRPLALWSVVIRFVFIILAYARRRGYRAGISSKFDQDWWCWC